MGFSILLLLVGLWLVLDNPLENFLTLEGSCPSCGHQVKVGWRMKSYCPECGGAVISGFNTSHHKHLEAVCRTESRFLEKISETNGQVEQLTIDLGDTLDLHTFSAKEVPSLLHEFIDLARKADISLVKIVHGKGRGILRRRVRELLARDPRVIDFYDARPESGGWGATLVELKSAQGSNDGAQQS